MAGTVSTLSAEERGDPLTLQYLLSVCPDVWKTEGKIEELLCTWQVQLCRLTVQLASPSTPNIMLFKSPAGDWSIWGGRDGREEGQLGTFWQIAPQVNVTQLGCCSIHFSCISVLSSKLEDKLALYLIF